MICGLDLSTPACLFRARNRSGCTYHAEPDRDSERLNRMRSSRARVSACVMQQHDYASWQHATPGKSGQCPPLQGRSIASVACCKLFYGLMRGTMEHVVSSCADSG